MRSNVDNEEVLPPVSCLKRSYPPRVVEEETMKSGVFGANGMEIVSDEEIIKAAEEN